MDSVGVCWRMAVVRGALAWRVGLVAVLVVVGLLVGAAGARAQPAFAPVAGSPFPTGSEPGGVAFSPSGGLVAIGNYGDNTVSVFDVGSGGALTAVAGSPFPTGKAPAWVAFSPDGGLLATANQDENTVSVFDVGSGGALTAVAGSPFPTGNFPESVAFSPSGGLLAVGNAEGSTVSVFDVGSGGALTAVAGSPFPTRPGPVSVAFSPGGGLLATANELGANGTVSMFAVGSGGAVTAVTGSPFPTGPGPESVAFSPGGGLLATANVVGPSPVDGTVSVFDVGSGGALTAVPDSPFQIGRGPTSVAFSPGGGLLATANQDDNTVSVFDVGSDGALTAVAGSPFPTGMTPSTVAFSPSGGLLAITNLDDNTVSMYAPTQQTQTSVTSVPNPALATEQVTLTATVTPTPDGGTVAFDDGTATIAGCGSQPVDPTTGIAICQTSALTVGTHSITAVYGGADVFLGSTSTAVSETVIADNPQNLGNLTLQDVEGSAKFKGLPHALQTVIELLANQAIAELGKITPHLSAAQLAKLAAGYEQGVSGLQSQGYLTATQASTLDGLAGNVQP